MATDQILAIKHGQTTEKGTHQSLLTQSIANPTQTHSRYAALWTAQQSSRRWRIAA